MNRCAPDLSFQSAQELVRRDVQACADLIGEVPRELGGQKPIDGVVQLVNGWLESPESLERGEILSRILRLPPQWTNTLLEYVLQVRPYDGARARLDLEVTILNTSGGALDVLVGVDEIPRVDPTSGEKLRLERDILKRWGKVGPGETTTVDARWGVHLLFQHGWMALKPGFWAAGAELTAGSRPLREVGYSARYVPPDAQGARAQRSSIDSFAWQLEQATARLGRARELASSRRAEDLRAAAELLEQTPAWWPRPDGWGLEEKARGKAT